MNTTTKTERNVITGETRVRVNPSTLKSGDTLIYSDGRPGHCGVRGEVLSVTQWAMLVQFQDRVDTTKIRYDEPEWLEHLTVCEPYKVEAIKITYTRKWTAKESPLGGWKYDKAVLGETIVEADSVEAAERQAARQFPQATWLRVFCPQTINHKIRNKIMATLYKHGELGQIERLAYKVAYCADGKILRNDGDGWKQWRKVKPGIDPVEHWNMARTNYAKKLSECPCYAEFRRVFHATFGTRTRSIALAAIDLMPQDPDGVWSELNDYVGFSGASFDLDEIVKCCRAYQAMEKEKAERKAALPLVAAAQAIMA